MLVDLPAKILSAKNNKVEGIKRSDVSVKVKMAENVHFLERMVVEIRQICVGE